MSKSLAGGLKLAAKAFLVFGGGLYVLFGPVAFTANWHRSGGCREGNASLANKPPIERLVCGSLLDCGFGAVMTSRFDTASEGTESAVNKQILAICDGESVSKGRDNKQNRDQRRIPISGFITAGGSFMSAPWAAFSPFGSVHLQYGTQGSSRNSHLWTLLDANGTYAGISTAKFRNRSLNVSHASVEEDENLTHRISLLQHAMVDRNSVQGLHLQQLYGAGCGIALLNRPTTTIEAPITIDYVNQKFSDPPDAANLDPDGRQAFIDPSIGTNIGYSRFKRSLLFGSASVSPSWSLRELYAANLAAGMEEKVSKRLGVSIDLVYAYIDNAPATFSGSSMQMNVGMEYSFP